MTTPIKLAITGISVSGLAVGTGFGIQHLTKKDTKEINNLNTSSTRKAISEWLKNDGNKAIISDADTGKWTNKWNVFRDAHQTNAPTGEWTIADWENKKTGDKGLADFKQLCKTNVTKEADSKDSELFKDVLKHCVE